MNKLSTTLVAVVFALAAGNALAADPPKDAAGMMKVGAKMQKPAEVTQEAWDKMSDADKKKAIEKAAASAPKAAAAGAVVKKEKKGGC